MIKFGIDVERGGEEHEATQRIFLIKYVFF